MHFKHVFKYGAATKKTAGCIISEYVSVGENGREMFAVESLDPNTPFATHGDSGALVILKADENVNSKEYALGIVHGGNQKVVHCVHLEYCLKAMELKMPTFKTHGWRLFKGQ